MAAHKINASTEVCSGFTSMTHMRVRACKLTSTLILLITCLTSDFVGVLLAMYIMYFPFKALAYQKHNASEYSYAGVYICFQQGDYNTHVLCAIIFMLKY